LTFQLEKLYFAIGKSATEIFTLKRIVIVGGGYAGTALARALDGAADVLLVEPRDRFVHNVAALRAVAHPELFERAAIPYDRLLKRGRVIRGRAKSVTGREVTLANGDRLEADAVVVATGSHYATPFKPASDTTADMRTAIDSAHARVKAAGSVAIIGAGAVGVELAGELASAMPGRSITLVNAGPTLFPGYKPALGRKLTAQLVGLGVKLLSDVTVSNPAATDAPFSGTLKLSSGEKISADIVFPVMGATAENALLATIQGTKFDATGRAAVDPWLRPSPAHPTLFALGDAAATGDGMTIVAILRQEPWLDRTLRAVLKGKRVEDLPRYTPWPLAPILLPLGPGTGASILPVTRTGIVVGSFMTSTIKGKTLFIPKYRKEFGYV
jgi:NADH dehydrogenase FAD-containing subunit